MKTIQYISCLLVVAAVIMSFRSVGWVKRDVAARGTALAINGRAVVNDALIINSRGVLTVVAADSVAGSPRAIPFRLMLKRSRMLIGRWPESKTRTYDSLELDKLWQFAQPGDQLLVEPAGSSTVEVIQVIKPQSINWLPLRGPGDGC